MGLPSVSFKPQPCGVENHHDQGGQHVGHLDFYGENHVYGPTQKISMEPIMDMLSIMGVGEEYLDGPGQQSDAPLKQKQRDGGENGSHPEGGRRRWPR